LLKGTTAIGLSQHRLGSEVPPTWNLAHDFCITSPEAANLYHVGAALIGKRLKDFTVFPHPCQRHTLHKEMTWHVCTCVTVYIYVGACSR